MHPDTPFRSRRRLRRRWVSALAVLVTALAGSIGAAGAAVAATIEVPQRGPIPNAAGDPGAFKDRVFSGSALASTSSAPRARSAAGYEDVYTSYDGYRVTVELSPNYPPTTANRQAAQGFVDLLASNPHRSELGKLRVYLGGPREIERICGGDGALACYVPYERRMYVPAERSRGVSAEYVATHEYGHHLASYRSNFPWPALDWGAKHWASHETVCAGIDSGIFFPEPVDERSYFANPGEGFAETYAHNRYRDAPWQFTNHLRPTSGSFAAIRRDALHPWRHSRSVTLEGSLGTSRRSRTFPLRLSLDGRLSARLRGPDGSEYGIEVRGDGERMARTRSAGSRDRLALDVCRVDSSTETLGVRVFRSEGRGSFSVLVRYPG
jgi:hypothetical protein